MVSICFYFQVHQPCRLRPYTVFDITKNHDYFEEKVNREICEKVARKCYLPANKIMLDLISSTKGKFRIAYSISGVALEQFEKYTPEVISSFQKLADTGNVEFLNETYYHSLAFIKSKKEFARQIKLHKEKMKGVFGVKPTIFRNTELVFNNELAGFVEELGFKGILAEGADHILGWRSPTFLYTPKNTKRIKLLLKNYRLSDDIAFRFSNRSWNEWPLTAEKYASWINNINGNGEVVNLFMDYETFGEHQWEETGIFNFLRKLPSQVLKHPENEFLMPTEVIKKYKPKAELDIHNFVSWADVERDLSAWLGNSMQEAAFVELYNMEEEIIKSNEPKLIEDWRKLQTTDHFYYMCTKWFNDGDVHKYFNPNESPYDSFIAMMNIINDLRYRLKFVNNVKNPKL